MLIGVLLSLPILTLAGATLGQAALLAAAAHVVGAWFAIVFAYWNGHYFVPGAAFAFALGLLLLVPLILIALARIEEIAAVAFGRRPRRLIASPPLAPERAVDARRSRSTFRPTWSRRRCSRRRSMRSRGSNYPNFECMVVINNTPDPAFWRPIEEHCRDARRALQVRARGQARRASRPARCGSRSPTPRPTPRSSACSTPTMSCIPTG